MRVEAQQLDIQRGRSLPAVWFALWTRSHCERIVAQRLDAKGFHPWVPEAASRSSRGAKVPMFPGYLFSHDTLEKRQMIDVMRTPGLVAVVGKVPDAQIESLRTVASSGLPLIPVPWLRQGARVRIVHGSLAGAEGILAEDDGSSVLVVSIDLFHRSLAVPVDAGDLAPA